MHNILSFNEFLNENKKVTYINDPKTGKQDLKSFLAFHESRGPWFAGFGVYGDQKETKLFPHLGDRSLMMQVDGPAFWNGVIKGLNVDEKDYGSGIIINLPIEEFQKAIKRKGFKKTGYEWEIKVSKPEDGVKIIVDALKPFLELNEDFINESNSEYEKLVKSLTDAKINGKLSIDNEEYHIELGFNYPDKIANKVWDVADKLGINIEVCAEYSSSSKRNIKRINGGPKRW